MAACAAKTMAQHRFDKVWAPDPLTYENVCVILAAILGRTPARVGASLVHPFNRAPVDFASSFAALSHLAGRMKPNRIVRHRKKNHLRRAAQTIKR